MVLMMSLYLIVIYIMLNNGGDNLGVKAQTSPVAAIGFVGRTRFHGAQTG
ncbi:hypothetical protein [uncultured Rikenella sp.]|nr:hypothetical protein [uncultured Rikenella sp.]